MWAVVNEAGRLRELNSRGFDIAGKTGTAQVVSLGKEGSEHKITHGLSRTRRHSSRRSRASR
jgi:cell division protein FtsI/penicillin-binding protein 2